MRKPFLNMDMEIKPADKPVDERKTVVEGTGELASKSRIYIPSDQRENLDFDSDYVLVMKVAEPVPVMDVTVSEPGQFVVPRPIRLILELSEGDMIQYELRANEGDSE